MAVRSKSGHCFSSESADNVFSKSFIWPWYHSTLGQGHQDLIISLKPSQWCICVSLVKICQIWPLVEDIKSKYFYGCMTLIMTLVTLKIGKDHLTEIRSTAPANVWTFMVIKKILKSKHLPGGTFSEEFMYQCSRAGASLNLKVRNRAKMRTNHPFVWYITFIWYRLNVPKVNNACFTSAIFFSKRNTCWFCVPWRKWGRFSFCFNFRNFLKTCASGHRCW